MTLGVRLHLILRKTTEVAWKAANRLIEKLDGVTIAKAHEVLARMDSVGQRRMSALHGGRRDKLEIYPNLWAGVGLVRGGAGAALVGGPDTVAKLLLPRLPLHRAAGSTERLVNMGTFGETLAGSREPLPAAQS